MIKERASHSEQVIRWAQYVREHPNEWKIHHSSLINAFFDKHNQVLNRLLQLPHGKEKIRELYKIKNEKAYVWLK